MIVPGDTLPYRRLCCKFCKQLREIYKENGWCLEERVINNEMELAEVLHQAEEPLRCFTIDRNCIGDCVQTLLYLRNKNDRKKTATAQKTCRILLGHRDSREDLCVRKRRKIGTKIRKEKKHN